jgi:molybdopterin molybdotransferase
MDGYALRAADGIAGARLKVIGSAPAGHPFAGVVGRGQAVRLFTGSVVPAGADTILLQEDASRDGEELIVNETCKPGRHIRPAGQDFALDDALLAPGRRLTIRDIALAAAANHPWLSVFRQPRVAILATGDEIALPGEPLGQGGIVNSNSLMLAGFVSACGAEPIVLPVVPDDREMIALAVDAARGAELLVTSGGASVGDHDLLKAGLELRDFQLDFWKIAMRPGKPLLFGTVGALPLLGLPGNPVSAFVCALLFLRPAIFRLAGLAPELLPTAQIRLAVPLKANGEREDFIRARLIQAADGPRVEPFAVQDSSLLWSLARSDALIRRPPSAPAAGTGDPVSVILLEELNL